MLCEYSWAWMWACLCHRSESNSGFSSQSPSFRRQGLFLFTTALARLGFWPLSFQDFSDCNSSYSRSSGIRHLLQSLALCEFLGSEPRSSCLCGRHFTHWAMSSVPKSHFQTTQSCDSYCVHRTLKSLLLVIPEHSGQFQKTLWELTGTPHSLDSPGQGSLLCLWTCLFAKSGLRCLLSSTWCSVLQIPLCCGI